MYSFDDDLLVVRYPTPSKEVVRLERNIGTLVATEAAYEAYQSWIRT